MSRIWAGFARIIHHPLAPATGTFEALLRAIKELPSSSCAACWLFGAACGPTHRQSIRRAKPLRYRGPTRMTGSHSAPKKALRLRLNGGAPGVRRAGSQQRIRPNGVRVAPLTDSRNTSSGFCGLGHSGTPPPRTLSPAPMAPCTAPEAFPGEGALSTRQRCRDETVDWVPEIAIHRHSQSPSAAAVHPHRPQTSTTSSTAHP